MLGSDFSRSQEKGSGEIQPGGLSDLEGSSQGEVWSCLAPWTLGGLQQRNGAWRLEAAQRAVGIHSSLSGDRDSTQLDLWFAFIFVPAWPEKVDVPGGQRGLWASPPLVGMLGDPDLGSESFWTSVFM